MANDDDETTTTIGSDLALLNNKDQPWNETLPIYKRKMKKMATKLMQPFCNVELKNWKIKPQW